MKRNLLAAIAIAAVGVAGLASIPTTKPVSAPKTCLNGTKTVRYAHAVACVNDHNEVVLLKAATATNRTSSVVLTPAAACFDKAKTVEALQACDRLERK